MVAACLVLLGGSVLLGRVAHVGQRVVIASATMPELCMLKQGIGLPCPGCGLTRSWIALAQGEPATSLRFHRLGWLLMAYALLQLLRHGAWLIRPTLRPGIERIGTTLDRSLVVLGVLLVANWVWVLVALT